MPLPRPNFGNENWLILILFTLMCVPWDANDDKSSLVYIMAWCGTGDKLLSKPMMTVQQCIYVSIEGSELIILI